MEELIYKEKLLAIVLKNFSQGINSDALHEPQHGHGVIPWASFHTVLRNVRNAISEDLYHGSLTVVPAKRKTLVSKCKELPQATQ